MIIENGKVYFIKDEFIEKYVKAKYIKKDKDVKVPINIQERIMIKAK